jgi:hypothetical protein
MMMGSADKEHPSEDVFHNGGESTMRLYACQSFIVVERSDLLCEVDHALAQRHRLQYLHGAAETEDAGPRRR